MERKFVYTLSSRRHMVFDAIRSIKTLRQYTDPENIIVFYTPPREENHQELLENLDVDVRLRPHKADEFRAVSQERPRHYGDKLYVCEVEADEVMFLDCDTIITADVNDVFRGNFEFAARPDNATRDGKWREFVDKLNRNALPWMPNAGLLVFKNGSQQRVERVWRKYINRTFDVDIGVKNYQDQYSLAIAVGKLDERKLTDEEHVFEWSDEPVASGTVHHMRRYDSDIPSEVEYTASKLYGWYQDATSWI